MEKCISCLAVIYQSSNNIKYATEMMHMVACFKKLWKADLKQAWLDYSLINLSGRADKFMADDRFGERIILLNKEKICPSANITSDEFLREIVAMNVISLWKCQEAVSHATGAISHGNQHSLTAKLPDILLLVKHMTEDFLFREQLGRTRIRNNGPELAFPDLFAEGTARLSTGVELARYVSTARRNWDNYEPDNNIAAGVEKNDDEDIGRGPPEDLYELYDVYD